MNLKYSSFGCPFSSKSSAWRESGNDTNNTLIRGKRMILHEKMEEFSRMGFFMQEIREE